MDSEGLRTTVDMYTMSRSESTYSLFGNGFDDPPPKYGAVKVTLLSDPLEFITYRCVAPAGLTVAVATYRSPVFVLAAMALMVEPEEPEKVALNIKG